MRLTQLPLVLAFVQCATGVAVAEVPPQLKGVTYTVNEIDKVTPAVSKALPSMCGEYRHLDDEGVKIMGGSTVPQGRWPFAVALYGTNAADGDVSTASLICTGSLISAHHVLTAAHCFGTCAYIGTSGRRHEQQGAFKTVYAKVGKISRDTGTVIRVSAVLVHDYHWSNCSRNDVAIAQLARQADMRVAYNGHPIHGVVCLPHIDEPLHEYFYAIGYGFDPHRWAMWTHGQLQEVLQFPAGKGWCERLSLTRYDMYRDRYICTQEGERMVCRGDSGGPLLQTTREGTAARQTATIVGVTHMGTYCAALKMLKKISPEGKEEELEEKAHGGSMFTDVRKYVGWICNATGICYSTGAMETSTRTITSTTAATRRTKRRLARRTRPAVRTKPTKQSTKSTEEDCAALEGPYVSAVSMAAEVIYKARHIKDYRRCKRTWELHAIDWCRRQYAEYERDRRTYRRRNAKLYVRCRRRW